MERMADGDQNEGDGHGAGESARAAELARAGAEDDARDREEQYALHHHVVGDEVKRRHPAEMAHERDRGDDVAELAHARISEQALEVGLAERQERAGDRREHADPGHAMRELDRDLGTDRQVGPGQEAEHGHLADDGGEHGGEVVIRLGIGARQPDMHADGAGLDQKAHREQHEGDRCVRPAGDERRKAGRA